MSEGTVAEDESPQNTTERLTFSDEWVAPILRGDKTATVRYGGGGTDLVVGDELYACMPDGTEFARIGVKRTVQCLAVEALEVINVFGAEYAADTTEELIDGVSRHYTHDIGPGDTVAVVVFEVIDESPRTRPSSRDRN